MYKRYIRFVIAKRKWVACLIGLISIFFAINLLNLRVNSSPYFMDQLHESRIHELDIKRLFTNSGEQILVAFEPNKGSPLDRATIDLSKALTKQFQNLNLDEHIDDLLLKTLRFNQEASSLTDRYLVSEYHDRSKIRQALLTLAETRGLNKGEIEGVLTKIDYLQHPIRKVRSFSTIENITSVDDELDLHPLLPEGEPTEAQLTQFQKEVRDNPLFKGLLISEDEKVASIQIELTIPKDDNRSTGMLYAKVVEIVDQAIYDGEIYLAGNPVIDAQMAISMERDNLIFFPFVIGIVAFILFIGFKSAAGILIPLIIAGLSALWTVGLMVFLGIEQNIVSTSLPVFLLTVAVADAIHFYSHYRSGVGQDKDIEPRLVQTFSLLTRPLVLTSITTMMGFLALAWTDITFIREFGLLMVAGVCFALLITFVLAPILAFYIANTTVNADGKVSQYLSLQIQRLVNSTLAAPGRTVCIIIVLLASSLYSLQSLKFDQENINNFDSDTVLRLHNDAMLEHYQGTIPIDIWIDTGKLGGIYDKEFVEALKRIDRYFEGRDDIGFVLSPLDFYYRMYDLMTNEGHQLPEDFNSELIAQLILLYENESSQNIKHVIDDQHRHARIMVLGKSDAASYWEPILKDIEAMTPKGTHLEINGYGRVMHSNIEEVIKTNISSTILALCLITVVMVLLFRALSYGLIGIAPLILTVIMNYAVMSALGVAVDVGTTIIASIAFGIGIDYSIHFLAAIKNQLANGDMELKAAILSASRVVGLPITINSLTLAGGFLVLITSNFLVLKLLGLFISMTMLISAINALVVIPLLFYLWHRSR